MTGATPRPWRVTDVEEPDGFGPGRRRHIGTPAEVVCKTVGFDAPGKDAANAALIVRAVNHHEALVTFVQAVADYLHQLDPRTLRDDARALLARIKAEA